jgi:hypothetical protein
MQLIVIVGMFALSNLLTMWKAFVFTMLWAWFIVPVFHLPMLPLMVAFGVSLIVSMLTYQNIQDKVDWKYAIYFATMVPMMILFFGWVAHLFL